MRAKRDESGAVAVLVGIMALFLVGLMAFSADLGMAYANKRQLQTAADAAALGAAGEFIKTGQRNCSDMKTAGQSAADTEANGKVTANTVTTGTATLTGSTVTAACTTNGLEVTADVTGTSPNIFGGILGKVGPYDLDRTATAIVEPGTGARVRPLGLCSSELLPTVAPGDVFRIWAPGNGHVPPASCPQESDTGAGNWWTLDCPGEFNVDSDEAHGTSALEAQIRDGCADPITVVPDQGIKVGVDLNNHLASACIAGASTAPDYICMSGDPGQPDAGGIEDAWEDLIKEESTVTIPVFCAGAPGLCDHSSVTGTGTNTVFPVHKFVGVTICGYHFGKQPSKIYREPIGTTTGACAAANVQAELALMEGETSNAENWTYLVAVYQHSQVTGSVTPSTCPFGDVYCDTLQRQTRLIQ